MDGGFRIIERGLEPQASEPSGLKPQPVASPAGSSGPQPSREKSFSTVAPTHRTLAKCIRQATLWPPIPSRLPPAVIWRPNGRTPWRWRGQRP